MNTQLVVLAALLAVAAAMPRYVLVPVEDLEMMAPHVRLARQAVLPEQYLQSASERDVRQAQGYKQPQGYNGGEQVDYGAYTGKGGAFGSYADYPVYSYGYH